MAVEIMDRLPLRPSTPSVALVTLMEPQTRHAARKIYNGIGIVNVIPSEKIDTVRGKRNAASVAEPSATKMSVTALVIALQGFLSSIYPKTAATREQRYIRAYFQVISVKRPTPTNIQQIKMMPAEVGLPLATAPSIVFSLPPSVGRFLLCLCRAIYVKTSVNKGPIRIQYFDGIKYANNVFPPPLNELS